MKILGSFAVLALLASSLTVIAQDAPPGAPTCAPNDTHCTTDNGCNNPKGKGKCNPVPPGFSLHNLNGNFAVSSR